MKNFNETYLDSMRKIHLIFMLLIISTFNVDGVAQELIGNKTLASSHSQTQDINYTDLLASNMKATEKVGSHLETIKENSTEINAELKHNSISAISENIANLQSEVSKISKSIEDASPGFISSLFGWIFQAIAIFVGAIVAVYVMNNQLSESREQFAQNQLASEEQSRESWSQLIYSLGIKEKLENEKTIRENTTKLQENKNLQDALKIGLQIYIGVISDYANLALTRIESISNKPERASASLSSLMLPTPPPGLWENLPTYANTTSEASSMAIVASHLYGLGKHYAEIQKDAVISKIKTMEDSEKHKKEENRALAKKALLKYKSTLHKYFMDINSICDQASSATEKEVS